MKVNNDDSHKLPPSPPQKSVTKSYLINWIRSTLLTFEFLFCGSVDIQNSSMFGDESTDSMVSQQHVHTCQKENYKPIIDIIKEIFQSNYIKLSSLSRCYQVGKTCSHMLYVNFDDTAANTLHLTMFQWEGYYTQYILF